MKLKFLSFLTLCFAIAFTANAQEIAGTYIGTLTVDAMGSTTPIADQNIIITEENGTYTLSVLDFSFASQELGNLNVDGITTEGTDNVTLSKSGTSEGPSVPPMGATLITLNSASVSATGVLIFDLSVSPASMPAMVLATVTFEGSIPIETEIAGTYTGDMNITAGPEPTLVPEQNVVITQQGSTYTISVLNFSFMNMQLGDLEIAGISASETGNIVTLTKSEPSEGPASLPMPTTITVNETTITNGVLSLNLSVSGSMGPLAAVTFEGSIDEETAIEIIEEANAEIEGFYSLTGQKLSVEPTNGIYIVRFTNGKSVKVAKK
ncbi:MAG: calycin-like domain-containing protein [Bacteroidales bacterium]|jgi:hypothetical protein|nr:calycin-like domain-containing protein [Bacteroidales bacterium]